MSTDKTLSDVQPGGRVRLGTPGARWAAIGEPDPHGTRYDCERAALVMGDLTDDELANAVFMHGNERQTMAELIGGATPAIAYLTAAKDRIRWLSRALAAAESLSAQHSPGGQGAPRCAEHCQNGFADICLASQRDGVICPEDSFDIDDGIRHNHLAARQPVGEPAYNSAGISLTACQLHEALLMAGDPELDVPFEDRSLVRIFWTDTGHSGPGLYCECVGAEEEGCILLDGTAPAIGQSSQAVDLAMPIAMIDQALGHLSTALDDLDSSPDARPGAMVTEAMGCLRQALTGVQP
ncbi:hypothetical protein ABM187_004237 [Stenotrophomonas maltophilia]